MTHRLLAGANTLGPKAVIHGKTEVHHLRLLEGIKEQSVIVPDPAVEIAADPLYSPLIEPCHPHTHIAGGHKKHGAIRRGCYPADIRHALADEIAP